MSRHLKTLLLGLGIMIAGALLCLSWPGQSLEESLGLNFLFKLRGPRPTPSQVAIIAIDLESARKLDLSSRIEQWPRLLHARLIEQLSQAGAKVIALDIIFREKRDEKHDRILAESIKKAGNVVLIALMEKDKIPLYSDSHQLTGQIEVQKLVQPIDQLKAVAAATAPFPIPKVPVRVNRYWTLASDMNNRPTLPLVAFQIFARKQYNHLVEWLRSAHIPVEDLPPNDRLLLDSRKVDQIVYKIRKKFLTEPDLLKLLRQNRTAPLLDRLIRMYAAPNSHFLNYYGPPGTIDTVSYHRLVSRGEGNDWVISDL